jgi:Raf kinase inhibitor-like YbhB/YbcL family protein
MTFILSSAAFAQGARIPTVYTCDGDDTSPPLQWQSAPDGTRSFLIACDDPDAPGGIFRHWAAYDIPADWSWLPAGLDGETLTHGIRQAINDFENPGYNGPCPPQGHGPHNYHFRVTALSEPTLPVASGATCVEVQTVARPYVIDFIELVGVYER